MEELFSKNQQMKEQQRILTDNIKTLENRWAFPPLVHTALLLLSYGDEGQDASFINPLGANNTQEYIEASIRRCSSNHVLQLCHCFGKDESGWMRAVNICVSHSRCFCRSLLLTQCVFVLLAG